MRIGEILFSVVSPHGDVRQLSRDPVEVIPCPWRVLVPWERFLAVIDCSPEIAANSSSPAKDFSEKGPRRSISGCAYLVVAVSEPFGELLVLVVLVVPANNHRRKTQVTRSAQTETWRRGVSPQESSPTTSRFIQCFAQIHVHKTLRTEDRRVRRGNLNIVTAGGRKFTVPRDFWPCTAGRAKALRCWEEQQTRRVTGAMPTGRDRRGVTRWG